ncbi:response regulator transcription factor [Chloroflexota bacterium]
MKQTIRILLVDDHELVRHGLHSMLEQEKDMEVVGSCANAEEAIFEMLRLHQDIVLMGIQMPVMNVIEAIRSLKRTGLNHGGDIIILAESENYRTEALEAGATSYFLKDITRVELVQTIRQAYRNRHSLKEGEGFGKEAVELVVPPSVNAAQLLRFMCQLGEIFHDDFASIICTVGAWDRGTVIIIQLRPTMFSSLLVQIADMAEVEKIEEEPLARGTFSSAPKKFGLLPRLGINLSKRFRVILKEADMARQELVTVSN